MRKQGMALAAAAVGLSGEWRVAPNALAIAPRLSDHCHQLPTHSPSVSPLPLLPSSASRSTFSPAALLPLGCCKNFLQKRRSKMGGLPQCNALQQWKDSLCTLPDGLLMLWGCIFARTPVPSSIRWLLKAGDCPGPIGCCPFTHLPLAVVCFAIRAPTTGGLCLPILAHF